MLKSKPAPGFTLVELLIVIVVIAILAAISVVAYNGVQNRAKSSTGQVLATEVVKKAESYRSVLSRYPTHPSSFNAADAPPETNLDTPANVVFQTISGAGDPGNVDNYHDGTKVIFRGGTTGGCVHWWDYVANPPARQTIRYGALVAGCG